MYIRNLKDEEPSVMIFKDDDGWWRIISEIGMGINKYDSYEDAVLSLPKWLQEGLI